MSLPDFKVLKIYLISMHRNVLKGREYCKMAPIFTRHMAEYRKTMGDYHLTLFGPRDLRRAKSNVG